MQKLMEGRSTEGNVITGSREGGCMRKVMITFRLFYLLYRHFVLGVHDKEDEIREQIIKKNEALANHELYTQSKTATTEQEREDARQKYLDMVGIPPGYRY